MAKSKSKKKPTRTRGKKSAGPPKTVPTEKAAETAKPQPDVPIAPPSPTAWRIVSRQQLAELMGQHPDTITDYAREGMPVKTRGGQGKLGEYDAVECMDWWRSRIGKNAKEAAQTRALNASAEINELKRAQLIGTLVDRDEVIRAGQMYVAAWKAAVIGLARRMAQEGVIDNSKQPAVEAMCRSIMLEIAAWKTVKDLEEVPGFEDQFEFEEVTA